MLRPQSSHLHVIDRPPPILANLADSSTEPSKKDFGFWQHILYLWPCQRKHHQQIVGKCLTLPFSYQNMQADVPLADCSEIHSMLVICCYELGARVDRKVLLHEFRSCIFPERSSQYAGSSRNRGRCGNDCVRSFR